MIAKLKKFIKNRFLPSSIHEKNSVEAYDIWSANYDEQPGNLMLDLDELLFVKLLANTNITGKQVADIGCGTGRHWPKLLAQNPASLTGFDVSAGMLRRLQEKFPSAKTYQITDDLFSEIPDESYDIIVSTLTVAHIQNIEAALTAWRRILKKGGEIVITDFHPYTLANGGKRTFRHQNYHIAVRNFVHATDAIKALLLNNNFTLVAQEELKIDSSMKHYYEAQNALHVYDNYLGSPIIYGMHFKEGK